MPPAGKAKFPVPEEYQDRPPNWQNAFQHAKSHGNPDKSAVLYAEANAEHHDEVNEKSYGTATPDDV